MRLENRQLHDTKLNTEVVKSGLFRLASDQKHQLFWYQQQKTALSLCLFSC